MVETLYRKYRPQTFADVVGQEHVIKTLQNQIKHGQIAHAYLFSGPRGIGKTTTARLLAKAAQAHDAKTGEPDEASEIVKSITAGTCLDLVEIDAASNRKIEEIRELREHVKYPPNQAKYKVFIIDEVHMLTTEAFNALLKTLEEPPSFVIFILATTELTKLPDTIISRCQRFDFKLVSSKVMQNRLEHISKLEKVKVDEDVLRSVVKLSGGCVRDAESLFGQILSINKPKITTEDVKDILPIASGEWIESLWGSFVNTDIEKSINTIHDLEKQGIGVSNFFADFLEFMRLVLLWRVSPASNPTVYVVSEKSVDDIKKTVNNFSIKQIQGIIDIFLRYHEYVAISAVNVLSLEMAVIAVHELLGGDNNIKPDNTDINNKKLNELKETISNITKPQIIDNTTANTKTKTEAEFMDWSGIVSQIQIDHPGFSQYLVNAKLSKKDHDIRIIVGHTFHLEILKKEQSLKVLDKFLHLEFGDDIIISVDLNEDLFKNDIKSEPAVDSILETFGGQVIED